ncbi:MAG: UDP-N-acetylmuramate dehydrogenase [bacterium]
MGKGKNWKKDFAGAVAGKVAEDVSMSRYTSMRVGGPAEVLFFPRDVEDLSRALLFLREREVECHTIGLGTNLLVRDGGLRGAVVRVAGGAGRIEVEGARVRVWAGAPLGGLVRDVARLGLAGLEALAGIPGTVGGAVWMNAGAFGAEIGQRVSGVLTVSDDGKSRAYGPEDCAFGYRHSVFHRRPGEVIAEVELSLDECGAEEIDGRIREALAERRRKQPQRVRTAGSAFKNPPGASAARLIDEAGLKGLRGGGGGRLPEARELHRQHRRLRWRLRWRRHLRRRPAPHGLRAEEGGSGDGHHSRIRGSGHTLNRRKRN